MKKHVTKRVSLKQVVKKCTWEPAFFRSLLRDPKKALARAKMHLSAKEMRKLRRLTADRKAMKDFRTFISLVRKYAHTPQGILW
jgi:hypothetical protein